MYKEDTACIIGTQMIFKTKHGHDENVYHFHDIKRIPLHNFKMKDYQFRSKLANSGYQRICMDGIN